MLLRSRFVSYAPGQLAETEMAVGDEGAHPELLCQRKTVRVARGSRGGVNRIAQCHDVGEHPKSNGLVGPLLVFSRQLDGASRAHERLMGAAGAKIRVGQPGDPNGKTESHRVD